MSIAAISRAGVARLEFVNVKLTLDFGKARFERLDALCNVFERSRPRVRFF